MPYKNKEDQAKAAKKHYEKNKSKLKARAKTYTQLSKAKAKEFVNSLKNNPCTDCGQTFPICVMEFDHKYGKIGAISVFVCSGRSLTSIKEELTKCDLVCANCHKIRTHNRRLSSKLPQS